LKIGDIVRLRNSGTASSNWNNKYGIIIDLDFEENADGYENTFNAKILIGSKVYEFHPHDFFIVS